MKTLNIRLVGVLPVILSIALMHGCASLHSGASSQGAGTRPHDEATLKTAYDPLASDETGHSFSSGVLPPAALAPEVSSAAMPSAPVANPLLGPGVVDATRPAAAAPPVVQASAPPVALAAQPPAASTRPTVSQAAPATSAGPFTMREVAERPVTAPPQPATSAPARPAPSQSAAPAPVRPAPVASQGPPAPRSELHTIFFQPDGVTLTQQHRALIRENTQWLLARPNTHVVIEGHTDPIGAHDLNMAVGARRAEAVAQYMQSLGLSPSRMTVVSYGPDRPIDPRTTRDARARNRRVQFLVVEQSGQQASN